MHLRYPVKKGFLCLANWLVHPCVSLSETICKECIVVHHYVLIQDLRLLDSVANHFDLHLKSYDTQLSLIVCLVHLIDLSGNCAFTHIKSAALIH